MHIPQQLIGNELSRRKFVPAHERFAHLLVEKPVVQEPSSTPSKAVASPADLRRFVQVSENDRVSVICTGEKCRFDDDRPCSLVTKSSLESRSIDSPIVTDDPIQTNSRSEQPSSRTDPLERRVPFSIDILGKHRCDPKRTTPTEKRRHVSSPAWIDRHRWSIIHHRTSSCFRIRSNSNETDRITLSSIQFRFVSFVDDDPSDARRLSF